MSFNSSLFDFLHSFAGLYWPLDWFIVFLGTYLGPLLLIIALIFAYKRSSFKTRFAVLSYLTLTLILSLLIIITAHFALSNPRPFKVLGFVPLINESPMTSFPSGHTTFFVSLALSVWVVNRKYGYWFLFGAILIGIGRIMAGVHWPIDILGGILCGLISSYLAYKLFPHKEYLVEKIEARI